MSPTEMSNLGDVADFIRGVTFKPEDVAKGEHPDTIWCMRTKNVQSELDITDVWSISSNHVKRSNQYLHEGDILVSSANSWNLIGKCSWIPRLDKKSTFGGFVSVLRSKTPNLTPRYLYHWFNSPRIQATARSFGRQTTNISNLDIKRCLKLQIPLPSQQDQLNITEALDQVKEIRARRRRTIELLDELAQSVFLDMFGDPGTNPKQWPIATIGDLVESSQYGTSQKAALSGDLPVLRMGNITSSGRMSLDDLKYLQISETEERYLVREGEILFNRTNSPELVGKTAVYHGPEPMAYAGYLIRLRPSQDSNSEYISAYLNSRYGKLVLRNMCKSIVGMANINAKELRGIKIPQPPLALQNDFADRLRKIEELRKTHQAHLSHLDELFASVQQRAFDGTLWDDRDITV